MPPPCQHNPPQCRVGGPFTPGADCRRCWLYAHDARYRAKWGGDPAEAKSAPARAAPPRRPLPCVHLGAEPVGLRLCPTCRGTVHLKTFLCAAGHGGAEGVAPHLDCGPRCPDYAPRPA